MLGTILCILAFTLAFFFPNQFSDTDSYRTVNHTVTERFTSIRVESGSDSDLLLLPAEDDQKYQVVSHERENMPYRVRVENGTLIITPRDERKWYDYISLFPSSNPKITVYLSENIYDSLYVDSDTGDVETHGTLTFGDVDIRVSTGDVILKSQVSGTLNVKTSTGNIKAWGINPTSVNLTSVLLLTCCSGRAFLVPLVSLQLCRTSVLWRTRVLSSSWITRSSRRRI